MCMHIAPLYHFNFPSRSYPPFLLQSCGVKLEVNTISLYGQKVGESRSIKHLRFSIGIGYTPYAGVFLSRLDRAKLSWNMCIVHVPPRFQLAALLPNIQRAVGNIMEVGSNCKARSLWEKGRSPRLLCKLGAFADN